MQNTKRWLAAVLAATLMFGDCGSMAAFATENTVSENSTASDPEETDALSETDDAAQKITLPALQIGHITNGDALPDAADESFVYDLPLSFETSKALILFTNYELESESVPDIRKTGSLEWRILRGEKGLEAGSASLYDEEDDWNGFETVSSSPYFTLQEITDPESAYDRMMALIPAETAPIFDGGAREGDTDLYDYYIRAAYYPETEDGTAEAFFAAATIPFIPQSNTITDTDRPAEDDAEETDAPIDPSREASSVSENDTVSGNSADNASADTNDAESAENASDDDASSESTFRDEPAENDETALTAETDSTLFENTIDALADETEQQPLETAWDGTITLYQDTGADSTSALTEKAKITLQSGSTRQITAKADPTAPQTDIVWDSSDETVAAVTAGTNGTATITASAEGLSEITASYRGVTASIIVDVVTKLEDEAHPDNSKLLDLSGDIRVAGFEKESDALIYSGQKITQNLRVYHNNTLLKEKTDYTLTYKNNINAAAWNAAKAPNVTINLKGQYQGSVTLYYTIKPLDINDLERSGANGQSSSAAQKTPGYEQVVNYAKKLNIPAPVLTFGKKKLTVKKDFTCDYTVPGTGMTALPADYKNGDLYEAGKVYSYTVNGTGNFTGSFPMQLVILKDKKLNFDTASVKLDKKQYEYCGTPLTASDVLIEEVKIGGQVLNKSFYTYEVHAAGIQGAYLILSPTTEGRNAGYRGCKKITLKLIGDRKIKDAVPGSGWKETISFSQKTVDKNGGIYQASASLLQYKASAGTDTLTEGIDYTVKYGNAKKAGKVTVTFTGTGRYTGSLKLTYTITPNTDIKIVPGNNVVVKNGAYEVAYQKDGAVPELILKDGDYTVLKNKTDYTIKYKDNKTPGSPMTCEITGKGNYKGYAKTVTLTVTKGDIGKAALTAVDKPYSDKPNKWQTTVTIKDTNGKKLTAGKDYDKTLVYDYKQEQSPAAGAPVTVTAQGIGCYEGSSVTGSYRIFAKNISTLKVVIDPQEYTGEAVTLTPTKDIHVYANNTDAKKKQNEIKTSCYEIVEYKNNSKAGTAKVTLRGIGDYGGTKTYSFKINKKKYQINRIKAIKLNKTSISFPLAEKDETKLTLTATLTSESSEKIANTTVIWTSSNNNIVEITEAGTATDLMNSDGKMTAAVTARLRLVKDGTATITATSQDGNKKAQCKISVVDAPLLIEAGQTIKKNIGETAELHMEFAETQDPDKVTWSSNNADVVSVAKNGQNALLSMKKAGAAVITAKYTSSGNRTYTQECYAVAVNPDEKQPEGKLLVYTQKEGTTDDTPYINKMLRDWEWSDDRSRYDAMYLPAGVYHIDAVSGGKDILGNNRFGGIILTEGQKLIMSPSALLVAIGNSASGSHVIWVFGRENVTISGGQIIGERGSHSGSSGEWGHGIEIIGGENITIENVEISQCWGDGIYLGYYTNSENKPQYCDGVTIKNCNLHDNRRNNLSITDARNVTVTNCQFVHAYGTDPQYGIDIEPNKGKTCSNVTITDCTFQNNAKGTIQILGQSNGHIKGVKIKNCKGDSAPVQWSGFGGSVSDVTQENNNWNWKQ